MITTTETTSLTLSSLVKDFAAYNLWANVTLVNWLRMKPSEQLEKYVASSFPSLKETLVHIWDTERFWFAVIQGKPRPTSFREVAFDGSADDALDGLIECSEAFAAYVESLTDEAIVEDVILDTPWVSGVRNRFEFIHHCMNHGTYHRGQLITIGRNLGFTDAPMTDYNFYLFYGKNTQ